MSKQVEIKGDTLIVHTREDYESVKKVIFVHKEKDGRAFYPTDSRYINDLEQIEGWTICGCPVSYLIYLAKIFKDTDYSYYDLEDYTEAFKMGYMRAKDEFEKAIKDSIDKMLGGL